NPPTTHAAFGWAMLTTIVAAARRVTATGANRDDTAPYTRYSARRGPERIHVGRSSDDSRKYRGVLRAAASVRMARSAGNVRAISAKYFIEALACPLVARSTPWLRPSIRTT